MTATGVDYYALLGVDPRASNDELAQAYRTRAKELHPDAGGDAGDFGELATAYTILSNHRRRREYDAARARVESHAPAPALATSASWRPSQWSRRRAWYAAIGGGICAILGIVSGVITWNMHQHDAQQRAHFIPAVAALKDQNEIRFTTRDGKEVVTREPVQHGEGGGTPTRINIRYDPANPQHVIVDAGSFGRDITLAVVALKFLVGGLAFLFVGLRRLRVRD